MRSLLFFVKIGELQMNLCLKLLIGLFKIYGMATSAGVSVRNRLRKKSINRHNQMLVADSIFNYNQNVLFVKEVNCN